MVLQVLHVTYCEIETTLGIGTSIHSVLHEHLTVKKKLFVLNPTQFVNRSKRGSCLVWLKEMLQKYDRGPSKHVYDIVTGEESWIYATEPESKQQSTVWLFQDEPNPIKYARARSIYKQTIACFFGITGYVAIVPQE